MVPNSLPKHPILRTKRQFFWRKFVNFLFMRRWEYYWVEFNNEDASWTYSMSLNYFGRYGWEAVQYHKLDERKDTIRILLKRKTRRWNVVMDDDERPSNIASQNNTTHPYWK